MKKSAKSNTKTKPLNSHNDPVVAAQRIGQDYNMVQVAQLMGKKSAIVLNNKLNPNCDRHHLTLSEAIAITRITEDTAIVSAWAASLGMALVPLPQASTSACEEEFADLVMLAQETFAAVFTEIRRARADGVIDPQERAAISAAVQQALASVLALDKEVDAQVRELPNVRRA